MPRNRTFTIYDVMEQKGVFESNSANINSRGASGLPIYKKQNFPKMVYHPEGTERVTAPPEAVNTPFGPKYVGEQRALVNRVVNDEDEYKKAQAEGWWDTPAESIAARPEDMGQVKSPAEMALDKANAEIARLNAKVAELE